jgi:hypothetical protein
LVVGMGGVVVMGKGMSSLICGMCSVKALWLMCYLLAVIVLATSYCECMVVVVGGEVEKPMV